MPDADINDVSIEKCLIKQRKPYKIIKLKQ